MDLLSQQRWALLRIMLAGHNYFKYYQYMSYLISSKLGKRYICLKLSMAKTGRSYKRKQNKVGIATQWDPQCEV